jgi:hypothetical protein
VNSDPGENYGKIQVLQLPSNTTIPGPQQVQNNFESDPDVSSQLSLLRRGGSEVVLGNLLSLPFNGGLLYVEPVYIRAAADGFPLLRKVLAGYGANVALEDNLAKALAKVLGTSPEAIPEIIPNVDLGGGTAAPDATNPDGTTTPTDPIEQLAAAVEDAQAAFAEGQVALAEGDFAAYGQAQDRLQEAIRRIAVAEAIINPRPTASLPPIDPEADPEPTATDGSAA